MSRIKKYKTAKMTRNSYCCTPTQKFAPDSINTNLAAKPAPHLEPINYDRWSALHYKAQLEDHLTVPEAQELAALESTNMATIEKVYQRLRDDKKIQPQIEKIKAHPWVRVVES